MTFPAFRLRRAERDSQNDRMRFDRLSQLMSRVAGEIEREREGLEQRYSESQISAAFAQAAFENEGDQDMSSKAEGFTVSMMRYSERIAVLRDQVEFIRSLEKTVAGFAGEIGKPKAGLPTDRDLPAVISSN
jgi:hypothetical protein